MEKKIKITEETVKETIEGILSENELKNEKRQSVSVVKIDTNGGSCLIVVRIGDTVGLESLTAIGKYYGDDDVWVTESDGKLELWISA